MNRSAANKFVFSVYPTFLNYKSITSDLEMINYDIRKNILDKKTVDDDSIKGIELSVSVHSFGYQIPRTSKVAG